MKQDSELENLVSILKDEMETKGNWVEVKRPVLPRMEYNVYAYLDCGTILSDGRHETRIKTITVKYNGQISYSNYV